MHQLNHRTHSHSPLLSLLSLLTSRANQQNTTLETNFALSHTNSCSLTNKSRPSKQPSLSHRTSKQVDGLAWHQIEYLMQIRRRNLLLVVALVISPHIASRDAQNATPSSLSAPSSPLTTFPACHPPTHPEQTLALTLQPHMHNAHARQTHTWFRA